MEESTIAGLRKELELKKFQFNSIFEFSATLYSSFNIENIFRIYFSTLMGHLGVSRLFFYESVNNILEKRGLRFSDSETKTLSQSLKKIESDKLYIPATGLSPDFAPLVELFQAKKIHCLINMQEGKKKIYLGLGLKFNKTELTREDAEFSFFISRFALIAIDNAIMINRIIENKRIEHEMKIAKDIQLSLLPQGIPTFQNFDISVIYEPINEVGGDYYDILRDRNGQIPVLIADVEGKGLPAALLAASTQAIFHSLNELYFFEPAKFMTKANSLIYDFTKGRRFITLFWMLIDDRRKAVTYVNAGHVEPMLISGDDVKKLSRGGFLTGFVESAQYEKETLELQPGDIILAFTDGVVEAENPEHDELGIEPVVDFIKAHRTLPAKDLTDELFKWIKEFSAGRNFRDDFTLLILKVL